MLPQIDGPSTARANLGGRPVVRVAGAALAIPATVPTPRLGDVAPSGADYARLRLRQDEVNALAWTIRGGGRQVEIRKLYPPYPPELEARMAYLDRLTGLRRQIESIRYPQAPMTADAARVHADGLARELGRAGRDLLTGLGGSHAISTNRGILEGLARDETV